MGTLFPWVGVGLPLPAPQVVQSQSLCWSFQDQADRTNLDSKLIQMQARNYNTNS